MAETYDALVLAGGTARRLGGVDKPALVVGESTLLDRVLGAVIDAARVVVVGPERPVSRAVTWTREEPAGGGPVAALAAGLQLVDAPVVALLAGDLPFLTAGTIALLLASLPGRDGALVVDESGRDQLLLGVWRTAALRAALPAEPAGARLGAVLSVLHPVRVSVPAPAGRLGPWFDCDTDDDLATARGTA
ncbi:MAG: molybdenum cofactor guanylyltransferase [Actinomycetota bacterium]|nr:molybdenum cofactor guanylyltransferase [Actinomycetota bacterium]